MPGGGPRHAVASESNGPVVRLPVADVGVVRLLTYNVAGLPELISPRRPAEHNPQIGARLDGYDLVLLQEDFAYHDALRSASELPFCTGHQRPTLGVFLGDGLTRLTRFPFEGAERRSWEQCHGIVGSHFDCWASKGFSVATHHLARGAEVDVYNVHFDAGSGAGDVEAQRAQVEQLVDAVERRAAGRAVVVAGDLHFTHAPELSERLREGLGARYACADTERGCDGAVGDRVLYRPGDEVELTVAGWRHEGPRFRDGQDEPLSDHPPVRVELRWARK